MSTKYASFPENDTESVRKLYENMTLDEMSQHMAENYRELSRVLQNQLISTSSSSSESTPSDIDETEDNESLVERTDIDAETKQRKMNKLFARAVSSGQTDRVAQLLTDPDFRKFIDINAKDEDGTTPLIYAACFGKVDIAQMLLEAGAKTDIQDASGWSALMWATTNHHGNIVKVLMDYGASAQTRTAKGRTVFDYSGIDEKIFEILATNPRNSISSSVASSDFEDYFYHDSFMIDEEERRRKLLETAIALVGPDGSPGAEDDDDNDEPPNEFCWEKCMPDQMFVFGGDDLSHILETVITRIKLPIESHQDICVPANVIFLSARFAHYFSSPDLLNQVMSGALSRIGAVIKDSEGDVHMLAFWLSNQSQLLHYLKKDAGLVVSTADYQLNLSEMISETYAMLVADTARRLGKVLCPAMLEHEQVEGMEDVCFVDEWQRFFRRNSTRRSVLMNQGVQMRRHASLPLRSRSATPQQVTSVLSTAFYVLQKYEVPPTIIIQALAQFMHFMSCELFNRILTNKKLLSRSKAFQIRMNLSYVQDWVRHNRLPSSLFSYLSPVIQLLQLLQCVSQLADFESFIMTLKKFDALNALQVKRCVVNYRYEVKEPRVPDEIEQYITQLAHDTIRYRQTIARLIPAEREDVINETLDARFMLPFSLPTTAHTHGWIPKYAKERSAVPVIPESWMEKLDYAEDMS
ncbi:hypothetical protein BX666DRAFT_2011308 [Dichotomocladium elegans]|nr:hypothetical protein BX666DRAFT_2011308 [Dichotomocladium elegans]